MSTKVITLNDIKDQAVYSKAKVDTLLKRYAEELSNKEQLLIKYGKKSHRDELEKKELRVAIDVLKNKIDELKGIQKNFKIEEVESKYSSQVAKAAAKQYNLTEEEASIALKEIKKDMNQILRGYI